MISSLNVRCWTILAVIVLALPLAALATPQVGAPAPDFTGTDSQGDTHRLSDYRGKIVVLEWTNHECPFVGKHYGTANMQRLQQEAAEQDVVWLSIISSAPGRQGHVSPAEANELTASRNAAPSAVLLDPEGTIGQVYGAKTTPHMYIIDPEGKLVYMGGIDDTPSARWSDVETAQNYVRTALVALAEDKPVESAVTRPYGCTVKY
jgi:peroxiredoxin